LINWPYKRKGVVASSSKKDHREYLSHNAVLARIKIKKKNKREAVKYQAGTKDEASALLLL
jgi:hypothetical protein